MILLCNEIKENRKKYIDEWDKKFNLNLKTISIPKNEVKEIIQSIDPRIEFTENREEAAGFYYYDKKKVITYREKLTISKKNDLEKALKHSDDKEFIEKIKKNFRIFHSILNPYTVSNPSILEKIENWQNRSPFPYDTYSTNISENLIKLIQEIREMEDREDKYYQQIATIENILNAIENQPNYRKILYDPYILNHKKLLDEKKKEKIKPRIDLIIYTDHYFGRKNFRLYWQPTEWKYKPFL